MVATLVIAAIIIAIVGLAAFILKVVDRLGVALWRRRNPSEKLETDRKALEERLTIPDWDFYESHLQRPAPKTLREIYTRRWLITGAKRLHCCGFEICFEPLDAQALCDIFEIEVVPIATTDFGDPIYLRPGPMEGDIVYITYHDGGDTEVFAKSVDEMLAKIMKANPSLS